jgi:signal recognition particle GTPase
MDSMTPEELDSDTPFVEENRLKRVARGSGTRV